MSATRSPHYLASVVRELCKLARETEWVEFKRNNDNPREVGEYLSALSNAAALADKAFAYLVWGVDDSTRAVVGTTVTPISDKIGNEELESWLLRDSTSGTARRRRGSSKRRSRTAPSCRSTRMRPGS
jgi:ATP-dependent DNA helicase RecG